jgi:nucleoside-diphosphate-sugar epimerase
MSWADKHVLVTGGASFIGSHLTDALVEAGAVVRVADNLSSGLRANLAGHLDRGKVELLQGDLKDPRFAAQAAAGIHTVFHLAAEHGGRGYIDLHQVSCSTNLILDSQVFRSAAEAGVDKVVFASSGCVYPAHLQTDPDQIVYLKEDMVGPPYDADNLYGWAKLMGEMVLRAYHAEGRMKSVSLRYFTAYGPRCPESHAVMAMIARAFIDQSPFEVWGTGQQIRNWTHVSDIVSGTLRAAERIDDGRAFNLGTMERTRVIDAAVEVQRYMGKQAELRCDPSKPTGPYNRVCDTSAAERELGWQPGVRFADGLRATIDWYLRTHDRESIRRSLAHLLTERTHAGTR